MKKTAILAVILTVATLLSGCGNLGAPQETEKKTDTKKSEQYEESNKETVGESQLSQPDDSEDKLATFTNYIQKSEYKNAVDYYQEKISGNFELENQAQEQILSYCADTNTKALSEEYGESEVKNRLEMIGKVADGIGLNSSEYTQAVQQINGTLASKAAYSAGSDLEAQKNYADAMEQYRMVIEGDSNYASAQEAIGRCTDGIKQTAFIKAEELAAAGDYIGAIAEVKKAAQTLPDDSEIQSKITVYEKTYVSTSIESAESAFVTPADDWEKSLSIINAALQYYPEDAGLKEQKEYYSGYAPVALSKMQVYDRKDVSLLGEREDLYGTVHEDVIAAYDEFYYTDYGYVIYVLNGNYNILKMTIFGIGDTRVSTADVSVRDYSSGKDETSTYLYLNEDIPTSTKEFDVEVDVTGVQIVRIYVGRGVNVGDCFLQKNVK